MLESEVSFFFMFSLIFLQKSYFIHKKNSPSKLAHNPYFLKEQHNTHLWPWNIPLLSISLYKKQLVSICDHGILLSSSPKNPLHLVCCVILKHAHQQLLDCGVAFLQVDSFDGYSLISWFADGSLDHRCCSSPWKTKLLQNYRLIL